MIRGDAGGGGHPQLPPLQHPRAGAGVRREARRGRGWGRPRPLVHHRPHLGHQVRAPDTEPQVLKPATQEEEEKGRWQQPPAAAAGHQLL